MNWQVTFDNEYLSIKCRWLSMVCCFAVVIQHATTYLWAPNVYDWVFFCQKTIQEHCRFAVPYFAMFSGYFFVKSYARYGYVPFLKRKILSIYVPFVFACILGEIVICMTSFVCSTKPEFKALLGIPLLVTDGLQLSFHLWFLKGLLILSAFGPFCYFVSKKKILVFLIMLIAWAFPVINIGPFHFQYVAMLIPFFFIGAFVSNKDLLAYRLSKRHSILISVIMFIFLLIIDYIEYFMSSKVEVKGCDFRIIMSILFIWFFYDATRLSKRNLALLKHTFFIYLVHISLIRLCGGAMRFIFDTNSSFVRMVSFFANISTFFASLVVAVGVKRFFPGLYAIIAGGR